ncbi:MAG TPA: hypothetical protein VFK88_12750 [Gallionella sp.]|nr:hypothetical protein [Gallionella sp.]
MIPTIATDFRAKASFAKADEVALFRNLAQSIATHSCSTFINETHGGKVCNVSFTSVTGNPETCEIADLLIVSCGPNGMLRATFWQAKKQNMSKWLASTKGNEHFDFNGQFNQWDLLSRRPLIAGVGSFHPPTTLLSSFESAAIGSFGVFYQRGSLIEVSHSVAECISCHNPTVKHPKLSINGYLEKYCYSNGEIITRSSLEAFLQALFAHQIGAFLNPAEGAHRWLVTYARSKAAKAFGNNTDLRALDRFLNDRPPMELDINGPSDGVSVLIINEQNVA